MAASVLSHKELTLIDGYWRAANYLSVGQIYLLDNPLLRKPLERTHIKPRLLGHWGTTPGLNFVYAHLNRLIRKLELDVIYICGPGHDGGPGMVANTYLEGMYSERYPDVSQDETGMRRLFRQFSFPGGIPSHAAPRDPGSIHEGGELGYSLAHAYGAAFDNPDLLVACVIGDGEAETGPLATAWHSNKFLNPTTDRAVRPILHLNGYKIANPTILSRIDRAELESLLSGYGYRPYVVERGRAGIHARGYGGDPRRHRREEIGAIQGRARAGGPTTRQVGERPLDVPQPEEVRDVAGSLLRAARRGTKKTQQRLVVDGLGQVMIEARLLGAIPVPLLPIAGQGDEERRGHAGQLA